MLTCLQVDYTPPYFLYVSTMRSYSMAVLPILALALAVATAPASAAPNRSLLTNDPAPASCVNNRNAQWWSSNGDRSKCICDTIQASCPGLKGECGLSLGHNQFASTGYICLIIFYHAA
jgi:hypothetical protein